jgi:hypothetical protein
MIPGRQQMCVLHNKMRNTRFLVSDETGAWRCSEGSPCATGAAKAVNVEEGSAPLTVDICDLCNGDVREGQTIDDHLLKYHSTLVMRCNELGDLGMGLHESEKPSPDTLAELGAAVRKVAEKSDRGPKTYGVTVEAARQLSLILRHAFPSAEVFTFGSCVACGCWDGRGDVDFTLVDPSGWERKQWPPEDEGRVVLDVAKALRAAGFLFDAIEPLTRTRVPIVKHQRPDPPELWRAHDPKARTLFYRFREKPSATDVRLIEQQLDARVIPVSSDPRGMLVQFRSGEAALAALMLRNDIMLKNPSRYDKRWANQKLRPAIFEIDFDISCRAHGIRNSILLRQYMEQSNVIRAGSVYIKTWSKRSGVNNSKRGYLTSYAVNILWIYYLIRTGQAKFIDPQSIPYAPDPKAMPKYTTYLEMVPRSSSDPTFEQRLAESVTGFFRFFAITFDWKTTVVSISRPAPTTKERLRWTEERQIHAKIFRDRVWYHCCIEDPYEENLNLGRHISPIKKHKVVMEFIQGLTSIISGCISHVLEDRSSSAAAARCMAGLRRAMVGHMEKRMSELVAALRRSDIDALAAYEVEQRTTKLIDSGGYIVNHEQDPMVSIPEAQVSSLHIPSEAQQLIDEVDQKLKANPVAGVPMSEKMARLNLNLIYFVEPTHQRCFFNEADSDAFRAHHRAVVSAVEDLEQEGIDWRKEHLLGHVIDRVTVPFVQEAFDAAAESALSKKRSPSAAKGTESSGGGGVTRSSKGPVEATCDECNRRGAVWKTSDISIDPGRYCDACWKKFEA